MFAVLNELSKGLLTAKDCVEAAQEGLRMLEFLTLTLASKFMDEQDKNEEAIEVLEKHFYPVKHLKSRFKVQQGCMRPPTSCETRRITNSVTCAWAKIHFTVPFFSLILYHQSDFIVHSFSLTVYVQSECSTQMEQ